MTTFFAFALMLLPLIALHELGHYVVARWCGVKISTFAIGIGPKLFSFTAKSGIEYRVGMLPLGGYVKMLDGRQDKLTASEKARAFDEQHPAKQIAIAAAGPLVNFAVAFVLFFALLLQPQEKMLPFIGDVVPNSPMAASVAQNAVKSLLVDRQITAINHTPTPDWQAVNYALIAHQGESTTLNIALQADNQAQNNQVQTVSVSVQNFMADGSDPLTALGIVPWRPPIAPIIGQVQAGSAAEVMGLKVGDRVRAIAMKNTDNLSENEFKISDYAQIAPIVRANPDRFLTFTIERDGKIQTLDVMPKAVQTTQKGKSKQKIIIGQLGIGAQMAAIAVPDKRKTVVQYSPSQAVIEAALLTKSSTQLTISSFAKMLTGLIGLEQLSGPLTIAKVADDSLEMGFLAFFYTMAMISLSLAVLNLLPVPMLDGGHIVRALIQWSRGRRVSETSENLAFALGAALLFGFMGVAIFNDIGRFFG